MLKFVMRFDPSWPKFRLFRAIYGERRRKLAVALRPEIFAIDREWDGWRLTFLGIEIHAQKSAGGLFC